MPPRYSYWTIIADGLPTAFRAAQRDELLPTFARIKQKHPDAAMKWFARGKLWDSPESARHELDAARMRRRPDPRGRKHGAPSNVDAPPHKRDRGRGWRPGGDHRDPRQKFRDAKAARNLAHRRRKFERRQEFDTPRPGRQKSESGTHPRPPRPHVDKQRRDFEGRERGPRTRPPFDRQRRGWERQESAPRNRQPAPRPPRDEGRTGAPPRDERRTGASAGNRPRSNRHSRQFQRKSFVRNQGTEEPQQPPRPRSPHREPKPQEGSEPTPPPRPSEPVITPPGPPERGHRDQRKKTGRHG